MTDFQRKFCAARNAASHEIICYGRTRMMSHQSEFEAFEWGADWAIKFLMQSSEMQQIFSFLKYTHHKDGCAKRYAMACDCGKIKTDEALATIRAMEDERGDKCEKT